MPFLKLILDSLCKVEPAGLPVYIACSIRTSIKPILYASKGKGAGTKSNVTFLKTNTHTLLRQSALHIYLYKFHRVMNILGFVRFDTGAERGMSS